MKRRSFLQALGGAVAAVFAPAVASKVAAPLAEKYPFTEYGLSVAITSPETVSALRQLIEATYETVGEIGNSSYVDDPAGFGPYPIRARDANCSGQTAYQGLHIMGVGNNEREAVADAFKTVSHQLGGKELLWRRHLSLDVMGDFESGMKNHVVRGRAVVLV